MDFRFHIKEVKEQSGVFISWNWNLIILHFFWIFSHREINVMSLWKMWIKFFSKTLKRGCEIKTYTENLIDSFLMYTSSLYIIRILILVLDIYNKYWNEFYVTSSLVAPSCVRRWIVVVCRHIAYIVLSWIQHVYSVLWHNISQ